MKNKILVLLMITSFVLLSALLGISIFIGREQNGNLLMAKPMEYVIPAYTYQKVEELCEKEFLLTYETRKQTKVQAIQSEHTVIFIGTNSCYPQIMNFLMVDGSFFTKSAWKAGNRHVVLNETAAFQLFGSVCPSGNRIKTAGETWIVTGVIEDHDEENANLYIPSSIGDTQIGALLVLMSGGIGKEYVKNKLKQLDIYDTQYEITDLSAYSDAFIQRFRAALKIALCIMIISFICYGIALLRQYFFDYKIKMERYYFHELFKKYEREFMKMAGIILSIFVGTAVLLDLSVQILAACLSWQELSLSALKTEEFVGKMLLQRNCYIAANLLFYLLMAVYAFILIMVLFFRDRHTANTE